MAYIEFRGIDKYYKQQHVLKNLDLQVEKGGFVTLLGSSGCGKSTLLRCLAGLESMEKGQIFLDGEDITHKSPKERNVGMIFQQYSLFPTMNVQSNVSFGLKMRGTSKSEMQVKVDEILRMVDLKGMEDKYPAQLSGGEQQRVALARSLITQPKVLLLDEPFSAIDAKLRRELQVRVKEIHKELGMTSIFVTHDQEEAMTMSDTIHLMNDGIIEQSATPLELYTTPKSFYVASFIGNYNLIPIGEFEQIAPCSFKGENVAIRPETIIWGQHGADNYVNLNGVIQGILPQGNIIRYFVKCQNILFKIDVLFEQKIDYQEGDRVKFALDLNSILVL